MTFIPVTKKEEEKLRAAARRGARLLDSIKPEWANGIDLRKLNLSDCHKCVLGQLYGVYDAGVEDLWYKKNVPAHSSLTFEIQNGFDALPADRSTLTDHEAAVQNNAAYAVLTSEWRDLIKERRQA